ncbi:MAG TPA: 2-oxo acid dehydrogenase subunit E2 [Baekduia sp.]|nr:2-oxo acid dehydrogenase subunit E2 [Baekduia sp.]
MTDITIPAIGVAMTEATILEWLAQPGDEIAVDQPIVEIETDKATTELTSPAAGTLGRQLVESGETVPVGTIVARVLDAGEAEEAPSETAPVAIAAAGAEVSLAPAASAPPSPALGAAPRMSPRARRLAAEAEAAASAQAPPAPAPAAAGEGRFRKLIAAKTLEAWQTIPHFAVTRELDAEPLLTALGRARATPSPTKVTVSDLLLRALAAALAGGGDRGDVALAVATDHGVMNPVVPGVAELDLAGIAAARAAAVDRARAGRLGERDIGEAIATLSNLGTVPVEFFTGIVTPGQRVVLTVGAIASRPWVTDDGGLVVRKTLHATVNADHRLLDGADAAALLARFAAAVADPDTLLDTKEGA